MPSTPGAPDQHYRRFLKEVDHLSHPFGSGGFGERAESFARFFGTPKFLIGQTLIVGTWILINATHITTYDIYPFILLNLAFSLQAAYAAPLILLAQTRQADRDKAQAEADAKHREAVAADTTQRQQMASTTLELLKRVLEENTALTKRIDQLTEEIHGTVVQSRG